ncbi:hypothetical protein [Candidatus Ichthyocystis sparus]|uniref:hypothetical protein n=1 Tax=Candidatus Ichthyocystis sparus TaxID=1561004 RepID=UPI000B867DE6|nr:hypothetical protein [Candidatus Ichthyocystis sparus]
MADGNFPLMGSDECELGLGTSFISDGSDDSFNVLSQEVGYSFSSLCLSVNYEEKNSEPEDLLSSDLSFESFCQKCDDIKFGSESVGAEGNSSKEESCLGLPDDGCTSNDFSVISSVGSGGEEYCWMSLGDEPRYNDRGFDKHGVHNNTGLPYDEDGLDKNGMDIEGFDKFGFDRHGFDRHGFDSSGYDRRGFDVNGFHKNGSPYNEDGRDKDDYSKCDYLLMFKGRYHNN